MHDLIEQLVEAIERHNYGDAKLICTRLTSIPEIHERWYANAAAIDGLRTIGDVTIDFTIDGEQLYFKGVKIEGATLHDQLTEVLEQLAEAKRVDMATSAAGK